MVLTSTTIMSKLYSFGTGILWIFLILFVIGHSSLGILFGTCNFGNKLTLHHLRQKAVHLYQQDFPYNHRHGLWHYEGNHEKYLYCPRQQQQYLDHLANSYHPTGSTLGSTVTVGLMDHAVYRNGQHSHMSVSPAAYLWRHEQRQVLNEVERTPKYVMQRQVITVADNVRLTAMIIPNFLSI